MVAGRDLRPMAAMQQRLVDAQQSMEREYERVRHAESRYRLLFQVTLEAVLVLDAGNGRVSRPTRPPRRSSAWRRGASSAGPLSSSFDDAGQGELESAIAAARAAGRFSELRARVADGSRELLVAATLFRESRATFLLVRAQPASLVDADASPREPAFADDPAGRRCAGRLRDDRRRRSDTAGQPRVPGPRAARERAAGARGIHRSLARPSGCRSQRAARQPARARHRAPFATSIRGQYGASTEVRDLRGHDQADGKRPARSAFATSRRACRPRRAANTSPRSVQQMIELVGRVR